MTDSPFISETPKGVSKRTLKIYGNTFIATAMLGLAAYGLAQVPAIAGNTENACRALHVCAPAPHTVLPPLATGWMGSGATWENALGDTLKRYQAENPDWNIRFVQGQEYTRKDWGQPGYRFEGTFEATPKWTGWFG